MQGLNEASTSRSRPSAIHALRPRVLSVTALGLVVAATNPSIAASGFETPPVLQASDLAPRELLWGPRFHVEPEVRTDGLLAKFMIRSDFGEFEAEGPGIAGHLCG